MIKQMLPDYYLVDHTFEKLKESTTEIEKKKVQSSGLGLLLMMLLLLFVGIYRCNYLQSVKQLVKIGLLFSLDLTIIKSLRGFLP